MRPTDSRLCRSVLFATALGFVAGCGESRPIWHDQKLASGRTVKVTSCLLVWGVEHDDRTPERDAFAPEFVFSAPDLDQAVREREAAEAVELIRPLSEQWGLKQATVAGFPTTAADHKARDDLFAFERGADGRWSSKRSSWGRASNE